MRKVGKGISGVISITRRRTIIILTAFAIASSYLLVNLFKIQYLGYAYYSNKTYDQVTTSSPLRANRGSIYDSNMNLLATNKTVWRIFLSPRDIKKAEKNDGKDYTALISDNLSEILSVNRDNLYNKIKESNVIDITVKKSVGEAEYNRVLEFINTYSLGGLVFTEAETTRYYPEGTLAAHLLGFVGSDNQGLYGLEYYYEKTLGGTDGLYLYGKDANGSALPGEYSTYIPAKDGYNLVTTIDTYVQRELESQLERIRINHGVANRVTGIVMDTKSGAILAMATSSPFNPNSPYELDEVSLMKLNTSGLDIGSDEYKAYKIALMQTMWSNKAVSETYEPGSTFKIITVSAALELGVTDLDDTFSCHGYYTVGGWRIKCHKINGHGSGFNLAYGLQMSCNPTMMTLAERIGADNFYSYVEKFGYFEKTGIDLPSEASTIFHKPENIGPTELATISFGQRFKVTPIAHLRAIAAVANGGVLVTPYVVSKITDSDGNIISEHKTDTGIRVISAEIAKTVAEILEEGVSGDGGAKNAYVDGYKVAAKTGTSQKFDVLDANGNSYLRIGSTVAFAPSDDSGIAVLIIVDEPTTAVKYGSVVAAPYISSLLTNVLPYLEYVQENVEHGAIVENLVGLNVSEAKKRLDSSGIKYEIIGGGDTVIAQTPTSDTVTDILNKIILYTQEEGSLYAYVPSLIGKELSEANEMLINAGLNIRIVGKTDGSTDTAARVCEQSVTAGAEVEYGTVITVTIINYGFED